LLLRLQSSFEEASRFRRIIFKTVRLSIISAVALFVTSGSLTGIPATAEAGRDLAKAGNVVFAVVLATEICMLAYLYSRRDRIVGDDLIVCSRGASDSGSNIH
jgi:hypothetical protein